MPDPLSKLSFAAFWLKNSPRNHISGATTLFAGTQKVLPWQCALGHKWRASVGSRKNGRGCPFCSNRKVLKGFNDLKTKFPEIAKEADGWDPSTITAGSHKIMLWKCNKGHVFKTSPNNRTGGETGCRICAERGFNPEKPAWFYLMVRPGEQQFGITNVLEDRLKTHQKEGWKKITLNGQNQISGPHDGYEVEETEKKLKRWLRKEIGLVKGTTENWYTSKMEVHSLAELKEKSGIETSIF